ncbi:VCBS repeat-containing protein [Pseudozobellia sp. WGM2]|uniref:VCBS repeat-containing protein n=1 Tax=Pseudozobellia sp. WGM2 TaxID=2787625 RepID=UPI001ADECB24|nr:VCBS repeat-containing protein [Pseudozobellia sp. WGM2]
MNIRQYFRFCISSLFISLVLSCTSKTDRPHQDELSLLSLVPASYSNVNFSNDLPENESMNSILFEYYLNGAGVAIGDFDNDGLPDLYFASNLGQNKIYLNKGNLKFEDVTVKSGAGGSKGWSTGVTTIDINNDGLLDIYVCRAGRFSDKSLSKNELFVNQGIVNGIPVFEEEASIYGLDYQGYSTQAAFFDYDKDGDLDMYLLNHNVYVGVKGSFEELKSQKAPLVGDILFKNDNGKFVDVSESAGIYQNPIGYGLGISVGDLNNDGWPDLYIGNDYSEHDYIYLNNTDGTFTESIKQTTGHISNYSMGNDISDFNNDGLLDIVTLDMVAEDNYGIKTSMSGMNPDKFYAHVNQGLHYQYMYNTLQLNTGIDYGMRPKFSDIGQLAGVSNTGWGWGPLFMDLDNDGLQDLFVSNGIKRDFRNNDFNTYRRNKEAEIISNPNLDKKTVLRDLISKMPSRREVNYVYRNMGNLKFSDQSEEWGLSLPSCSNGAAYSDLDNDGDLDLVLNNSDTLAFVYKNNSVEKKLANYLKVNLKGNKSNLNGIGTRVSIKIKNKQQLREHYNTRGFQSAVGNAMHFGLGKVTLIDTLEVTWSDGRKQRMTNIESNQQITLEYKNARAEGIAKKDFNPTFIPFNGVLDIEHIENEFNDFKRESLLPHKMSQFGPGFAIGDVNGDGTDDFFLGQSMGTTPSLYLQRESGTFEESIQNDFRFAEHKENVAAHFFDADDDGDLDLYVVNGSNESENPESYRDQLFKNEGGIFRLQKNSLPVSSVSGSCVVPFDFDGDGDIDLFVGGRQVPGKYPYSADSQLLMNVSSKEKIAFNDVTKEIAPMLQDFGMVSDAIWADIDNDTRSDLIIVGEWMTPKILKNMNDGFQDVTSDANLHNETGWWNCISSADFDGDGDMDLVAGNLGLNYKYKANTAKPFEVYAADFDDSGSIDIVLGYHDQEELYPLRGRQCSSDQMPFIKDKFPTYDSFGKATMAEVFGKEKLSQAVNYKANNFATCYFENKGGKFKKTELPMLAQISSVNDIAIDDYTNNGNLDILIAGNNYAAEVETPRNDASYGLLLEGDGMGNFKTVTPEKSGLLIQGEVRHIEPINLINKMQKSLIFVKNNAPAEVYFNQMYPSSK